jgi:hypothetical protein
MKMIIAGSQGSGKTSLLRTLDMERTLFINIEGGDLGLPEFPKENNFKIRSYALCKQMICYITDGDPNLQGQVTPYSPDYREKITKKFKERINLDKYDNIFIDGHSALSKLCWIWVGQQSADILPLTKNGAFDTRGAYGLLGRELMELYAHLYHRCDKHVFLSSLLSEEKDEDSGVIKYSIAGEGQKTAKELPSLFDIVATLRNDIKYRVDGKEKLRHGLVCTDPNHWGYVAKDRSQVLKMVEPAHLGLMIEKILTSKRSVFNADIGEFLDDEIIY